MPGGDGVPVGRDGQRTPDLNPQMIPVLIQLRQSENAASPGTADVQMNRLIRLAKQRLRSRKLQRQLEKAAEGVDVLAQGSTRKLLLRIDRIVTEQSPRCGVTVQMGGARHRTDFTVAERSGNRQTGAQASGQTDVAVR